VRPRTEEILEIAINRYEEAIRMSCDLQRALAGLVRFEPARSTLNTTADLTRDIAAVQLSGARWLLDS
jgi:hypothetical protein